MTTIHHLTNKAIAVTGLPEGATDLCIPDVYLSPTLQWWIPVNGVVDNVGSLELPEGNWSILGFSQELKEDDWKRVVANPDQNGLVDIYKNYVNIEKWLTNATESGHSLLKSKDLDPLLSHLILIQ